MPKNLKLTIKEVVPSRRDAAGKLNAPGEAILVERGSPRWLVLVCPCGCGDEIPINLDERAGPAWRLYRYKNTGVSLFPSVWRDSDCGSHFVIWRDRIFLFGRQDNDSLNQFGERAELVEAVHALMSSTDLMHFADIAEALGEVPWDVLDACRSLTRRGRAREGLGKDRGMFGRT